ncbi:unnamed protein product, partial [Meganyctiphanes norvegica]
MLLQLNNSNLISLKLLQNILKTQLWSICCKTGFCTNKLPSRSYVSANTLSRGGFKQPKTRVSLLLGGNMVGEKLIPIVISKAKKPRAFGNRAISSLPVYYEVQANAWISSQIFWHWFLQHFIVEMEQRHGEDLVVCLVIDNCTLHPQMI